MTDRLPRKLAAILYADVAGYSRLTGEDEDATHHTLSEYLDLITATIESHGGQVMHYAGDAVLAQFSAVVDALNAAVTIQDDLQLRNTNLPDERMVQFRIGLNLGDVIEDRGDIYGDGVNVAARLEALAEPGCVCISDAVRSAIGSKLPYQYSFMGEHSVKNIKEPVRAYRISTDGTDSSDMPSIKDYKDSKAPLLFGKPSITVKPFEELGAEAEKDRLGDGFTNGVVIALTRVPGLVLVGDETPALAASKQMSVQEIGERFKVRYVLKGSVQKLGNRIRVAAEVVEMTTGKYVWAENLDREMHDFGDFFAVQDEVVEEIITALNVKLLYGEAARLVRRSLRHPVALERYYHGEDKLWRSSMKLEFQEVQQVFEEIVEMEPDSSVGYAAGALAYWVEAISGLSDNPTCSLDRATELARDALRLDDVTGYAHLVLAHVHLLRREFEQAMSEATSAVTYRPSCPAAYTIKSSVLTYLDQADEAVEFAQYALRLTPVHPPMYPAVLASAYYGCNQFKEAVEAAKDSIELESVDPSPYLYLAASYAALDRIDEAQNTAKMVREKETDFTLAEFAKTQPYKSTKTLDLLITRLKSAGFS
ncbi:MAG: adenylate/guanylate cyclase domain-containing protein [Gammaproteobacteria bacterium]|nr:adenylate/guanylate cyclase domain-containing protein [Gammaproteobacteria bacterium]